MPHFVKELSSVECKKMNQCFVCDKSFSSVKRLQMHQKNRHCKVIVFEILKEKGQVRRYANLWHLKSFDDIFSSKRLNRKKIRKNSIFLTGNKIRNENGDEKLSFNN